MYVQSNDRYNFRVYIINNPLDPHNAVKSKAKFYLSFCVEFLNLVGALWTSIPLHLCLSLVDRDIMALTKPKLELVRPFGVGHYIKVIVETLGRATVKNTSLSRRLITFTSITTFKTL